jgi:hypothetical protein
VDIHADGESNSISLKFFFLAHKLASLDWTYGIELWGYASQNAMMPVQNTADDHKCALVCD